MSVLAQPTEVASHGGERDAKTLGDLLHAQRPRFDGAEESENLLSPPCAAYVAATRYQVVVSDLARGGVSGTRCVVRLIVFAHGYRSYMREVRKSTLDAQINHFDYLMRI